MTTDPRTWNAGEMVIAAMLNTEIRDQLNSMFGAWSSYTPVWTAATTNPSLGNGSITGRYMKIGRTCHVRIDLTMGSTTTYGSGGWSLGLPVAASATGVQIGAAHAFQSQRIAGHINIAAGATVGQVFFPTTALPASMSSASATVPVTWAAAGKLTIALTYETAT
ncbi:hypothetical protein ACFVRD_40960 [Streptomyces sp. NPDC057908]|uniref:hypothetical protein n=1 Tax=Streptomyces sp. NPDC057908 TaxID=3346276 RepID=UPI0036E9C451